MHNYREMKKISIFPVIIVLFFVVLFAVPDTFADHSEVTIEAAQGSGAPGCELTPEGCYIPGVTTVDVGGKVIFSNTDSAAHTFTSGDPMDFDSVGTVFDSSLVVPGNSYEWTPTQSGEFPYFDIIHPWASGLIIVRGEHEPEPPLNTNSIVMTTDKTDYGHNDIIMVTGQVANTSGSPITITVVSPLNSIVTTQSLHVNNDGTFEVILYTAGAMWKYDGTYTIKANYGSLEKSNNVKIELTGGVAYTPNYTKLTDSDLERFEKQVNQWNAIIANFERNAEKQETRGNAEKADYFLYKASIYESLIEQLGKIIYE